jgi:chorismate lyase/3-hydroxybenzoate synthase
MEYRRLGAAEPLPPTVLCAISFGTRLQAAAIDSAQHGLRIHVNLPVLVGTGMTELWHADGPVEPGRDGAIHFATGGHFLAGGVQIDEQAAGSLEAAAAEAYGAICRFTARSGHRHLLRMYNYFSDINSGHGDAERYKRFCSGRAAGFHGQAEPSWPAATAVGRQDRSGLLQVYWLASSEPGRAIENPRQVSAYRYPRQYGPSPPCFSRAVLVSGGLLISGTASVLGHASHHPHDLPAQLDEILRNLGSLRQASGGSALLQSGCGTVLKVYVREPAAAGFVSAYLRAQLPARVQILVLAADICRRELVVEIDAAHFGPGA